MALLCDGIYKIRNAQFTNFVADLINGVQDGPVAAYRDHWWNTNDKWKLRNVGGTGNVVTLESVSTGSFATENGCEVGFVVGSPNPTLWTLLKEDKGRYAIQSPDAQCVWELPQGQDYVDILLVYATGQPNTRWYFERIGDCTNGGD